MLLTEIDHLATRLTASHLGTEIVKSPPEKELTNNRECVCVCSVCVCVRERARILGVSKLDSLERCS